MLAFEKAMLELDCLDSDGSRLLRITDDQGDPVKTSEQFDGTMFIKCSKCPKFNTKIQRNPKGKPKGLGPGKEHVKNKHRPQTSVPGTSKLGEDQNEGLKAMKLSEQVYKDAYKEFKRLNWRQKILKRIRNNLNWS
jgi:hypothetical protein